MAVASCLKRYICSQCYIIYQLLLCLSVEFIFKSLKTLEMSNFVQKLLISVLKPSSRGSHQSEKGKYYVILIDRFHTSHLYLKIVY